MESVIRTVETADQDVDVVSLTTVPAKLHLWRGDLATALDWFDLSVRHEAASPDNWIAVRALPGLATTLRRLGRRDEAEEQAERGVAMAKRLDVPHALAEGLDELGRLAAADDSVAADDLHHDAVRVRLDHGLETQLVDSLDALAERAAMVESHAEAARLLGASNAARGRVGYPRPPVDWPQHEQLVALLREALGEEAFASATSEGSALSTGDAVAYAARARGARGRPRTGWASLTPTEQRVVELASEGLNNPEIGRRLFMSRDTVKTHLSHVYAKLGVANRAELAALVARAAPFARGEEGGGRDSWDR